MLLDREARKRRKNGQSNVYGPNEVREHRFTAHEIIKTWTRPFIMFVSEPIVLWCSLLSGFSDALIFTFLEAFTPGKWYSSVRLGRTQTQFTRDSREIYYVVP